MRRVLLCVVACGPFFALGANKEDAVIEKVHQEFAANWNKHDPKAMASMFAEDADLITPSGETAKGRADIEKEYAKEQSTMMKASRFSSDCKDGIRMLKPDVAVVTCSFEVAGAEGPEGKPMPPMKGIYTATMSKMKGRWMVVAGRPMVPLQPPPGAQPGKKQPTVKSTP